MKEPHTKYTHLNIRNFHKRMSTFYNYIQELEYSISNQINKWEYSEHFNSKFNNVLSKSLNKIKELYSYLDARDERMKTQATSHKKFLSMADIPTGEGESERAYTFCKTFSSEQKTLLLLMIYAGRNLGCLRLAHEKLERQKDIYRILLNNNNATIDFDSNSNDKDKCFIDIIDGNRYIKRYTNNILKELNIEL